MASSVENNKAASTELVKSWWKATVQWIAIKVIWDVIIYACPWYLVFVTKWHICNKYYWFTKIVLSKHKLLIKTIGLLPFNNILWNILNSVLLKISMSSLKEVFSKSSVLPHFSNAHNKHASSIGPILDQFWYVIVCLQGRFADITNFLSNWSSSGMEVTIAPFVNISFSIFFSNLINVPTSGFFDSHSYLKGITAANLKWHLSNVNKIFDRWSMFW